MLEHITPLDLDPLVSNNGALERKEEFSCSFLRDPGVYKIERYSGSDGETAIYAACDIKVYDKHAVIRAVGTEGARHRKSAEPSTALIMTSELATEFASLF